MHLLPTEIPPNAVRCQCGCQGFALPFRMTFVEAQNHTRIETGEQFNAIKQRWHVRKECKDGFLRDLELTAALNALVLRLESVPTRVPASWPRLHGAEAFLRRLPHARAVWVGAYNMALRTKGEKMARAGAFKFFCFVILPELVAGRLFAFWKKRHDRRQLSAVPTPPLALPSVI